MSSLLPDSVPGMLLERIQIPPGERLIGVPHTPGTREYLTCEVGVVELVASGQSFQVAAGDVVVSGNFKTITTTLENDLKVRIEEHKRDERKK